jgi:hypothetical protein
MILKTQITPLKPVHTVIFAVFSVVTLASNTRTKGLAVSMYQTAIANRHIGGWCVDQIMGASLFKFIYLSEHNFSFLARLRDYDNVRSTVELVVESGLEIIGGVMMNPDQANEAVSELRYSLGITALSHCISSIFWFHHPLLYPAIAKMYGFLNLAPQDPSPSYLTRSILDLSRPDVINGVIKSWGINNPIIELACKAVLLHVIKLGIDEFVDQCFPPTGP